MSNGGTLPSLIRAWVLVRAEDPVQAAREIYSLNSLNPDLWPNTHIVRADVVEEGEGVDIVVPLWASDREGLDLALELIRGVLGVVKVQVLKVQRAGPANKGLHNPFPPHRAWGYVPLDEANSPEGTLAFSAWG
jgi:hypothetical protein